MNFRKTVFTKIADYLLLNDIWLSWWTLNDSRGNILVTIHGAISSSRFTGQYSRHDSRGNILVTIHGAIFSSRFTVNKTKDTKESHLLNFLCFKMPSYEMLPLIFMGVEMFLFDNSFLNTYLLNSQLNFNIKSLTFNYFIFYKFSS